ncbi:MAG: rhomboid family intramembrane serine protease, partial [Desulfobulbaceae bacterium]|nr:rhomboid family intramembrane serine protease [Desulfobulbaceae bacterium]
GAIAGMMGFYTIIFGQRSVGIFLSLGFYFTNTRVPAILLLPFWIGNELYQLFWGGPSNVAYVGHLGGLLSGAVFGLGHRKFLGEVVEEVSEEGMEERVAAMMETGLKFLSDLDFTNARKSFEEVLNMAPGHRRAMLHLFQIASQTPTHNNFHVTADKLLSHLAGDPAAQDDCLKVYRQYIKEVVTPRLPVATNLSINRILLKKSLLPEAASILSFLLKNHGDIQQIPGCLLNLAQAYQRQGSLANAKKCLQLICRRYSASPEFASASSILQKSGQN